MTSQIIHLVIMQMKKDFFFKCYFILNSGQGSRGQCYHSSPVHCLIDWINIFYLGASDTELHDLSIHKFWEEEGRENIVQNISAVQGILLASVSQNHRIIE